MAMNDVLTAIGSALRRIYGTVVERPLSWGMIDKLSALDDKAEGLQVSEENARPPGELSNSHFPPHVNDGTTGRK